MDFGGAAAIGGAGEGFDFMSWCVLCFISGLMIERLRQHTPDTIYSLIASGTWTYP
jgi:hypothetical protein